MNEFSVGNPVKTTQSWLDRWIGPHELRGVVERFRPKGDTPSGRTVFIKLEEPFGPFSGLWFAPNDLELDEQRG